MVLPLLKTTIPKLLQIMDVTSVNLDVFHVLETSVQLVNGDSSLMLMEPVLNVLPTLTIVWVVMIMSIPVNNAYQDSDLKPPLFLILRLKSWLVKLVILTVWIVIVTVRFVINVNPITTSLMVFVNPWELTVSNKIPQVVFVKLVNMERDS